LEKGTGVRRRVIGVTLTIVGVSILLFGPGPWGVSGCPGVIGNFATRGCYEATYSLSGLISWPGGWDKLFLPMLIIGVALVVTGIALMIKARRSRFSPP
jgi:hypothetical protein